MPAGGTDEMKRDILTDLLDTGDPSLFEDYHELDLAKTKIQAVIQVMDGFEVTPTTQAWVNIFLEVIDTFEVMTAASEDPAVHKKALGMAEDVNTSINLLSEYDEASSNEIPFLLQLALERFYRNEGEFFEEISRSEKETAVRIEYQFLSSELYRNSSLLSDASRMRFEGARTKRMYDRDMEEAATLIDSAIFHLNNSENYTAGFFDLTVGFIEVSISRDLFYQAKNIYKKHYDKKLTTISDLEVEILKTYDRMMIEIIKVLAAYLLIVTVLALILLKRINNWRDDLYDSRLGEELID